MPELMEAKKKRRSENRLPLEMPLSAMLHSESGDLELTIIDLSENGAKLHTSRADMRCPFTSGASADLRIRLPSGSDIPVRIHIAWMSRFPEGYLIGIRFITGDCGSILQQLHGCMAQKQGIPVNN